MSILVPEIPTLYGALDSAAFADGDPSDAHILRSIVQSANRLMARGEPLVNLVFDASTDIGETVGQVKGWGWPFWYQFIPGPFTRPKKPGLEKAKCFIRFNMRSGETAFVQVHTSRMPFDESRIAGDGNIVTLTGTGSDEWAELADIPISPEDVEYLTFWIRGLPTSTNGVTATYGAPNTGTITRIEGSQDEPDILVDEGTPATWNTIGNTWRGSASGGGHCVLVENSSGQLITSPRWITGVPAATKLRVWPPFEPGFYGQTLEGETYRIRELAQWRINNIALYAQTRT